MSLHLHPDRLMNSQLRKGYPRKPQMATTQLRQHLSMEDILHTLPTKPDTAQRPNPVQYL